MAQSIAQIKEGLAQREVQLQQELKEIAIEKNAIAQKEDALAKTYAELNAESNPDYFDATVEYHDLSKDKRALYERQVAAHQEAKSIQRQNQIVRENDAELNDAEIDALERDVAESETELKKLEAEAQQNPEQTESQQAAIDAEERELEANKKALDEKEQESEEAKVAAAQQEKKDADAVTQSCPNKCNASTMTVWPNNDARRVKLKIASGTKTLDVISLSKLGFDKNVRNPSVKEISAFVEGECRKGLTAVSPNSSKTSVLVRNEASNHCPVMLIKKDETDIGLPGTSSGPLKFNAFCPDPPNGMISDWGYVFKNVLFPSKAQSKDYIIEAKGCEGSYPFSAQVRAFPKIKAGFEVSLTYNHAEKEEDLPKLKADGSQGAVKPVSKELDGNTGKVKVVIDSWQIAIVLKGNVDHINLGEQLDYLQASEFLKGLRRSVGLFLLLFDIFFMENKSNMGRNIYDVIDGGKKIVGDGPDPVKETSKVWDRQSSGTTGKIALRYPNIKLAVEYENNEMEGKDLLDYKLVTELKADPLIGVGFELDVLSALVKIGMNSLLPGSSGALEAGKKFVKYIWPIIEKVTSDDNSSSEPTKSKIEDRTFYAEAGISLIMKLGANLGASGKWEKEFGQPDGSSKPGDLSVGGTAGMDFILEGKVYAKAKAWAVEFEAGFIVALGSAKDQGAAKLEFKAELKNGEDGKPKVEGAVEWTGLAILFMSYKDFSYKKDNDSGMGHGGRAGDDVGFVEDDESSYSSKTTDKKYENQWVLIEPGKFPKGEEVPFDQYAQL